MPCLLKFTLLSFFPLKEEVWFSKFLKRDGLIFIMMSCVLIILLEDMNIKCANCLNVNVCVKYIVFVSELTLESR